MLKSMFKQQKRPMKKIMIFFCSWRL